MPIFWQSTGSSSVFAVVRAQLMPEGPSEPTELTKPAKLAKPAKLEELEFNNADCENC
jgi:hypothetical protein